MKGLATPRARLSRLRMVVEDFARSRGLSRQTFTDCPVRSAEQIGIELCVCAHAACAHEYRLVATTEHRPADNPFCHRVLHSLIQVRAAGAREPSILGTSDSIRALALRRRAAAPAMAIALVPCGVPGTRATAGRL